MSRHPRPPGVPPQPHPPTCSRVAETCRCVPAPLAPSAYPIAPHGDGEDGRIAASPHDADLPAGLILTYPGRLCRPSTPGQLLVDDGGAGDHRLEVAHGRVSGTSAEATVGGSALSASPRDAVLRLRQSLLKFSQTGTADGCRKEP